MAVKTLALVQAGARSSNDGTPISNIILSSIPDAEFNRVRGHLEFVDLRRHAVLHEPNEKVQYVCFPNSAMLSIVVIAHNGRSVEAGIVGKEGVSGLASIVGLKKNPLREVVQISGGGFKIAVDALQDVLPLTPELQLRLSRYAVLHGLQVSQTAACNRLHDSEQRLSRWLLMTQDRVEEPVLRITHDFLATMLGTDRPSISLAAARLQKRRLIEYRRGSVKISNRKRLENAACECYSVVQHLNGELGLE